LIHNEPESILNESESIQTDSKSNSELEEILENDNNFIEYFSDYSGNLKILIFVIIIIFYIYYLNYIKSEFKKLNNTIKKAF